jgi:hypothetical protein
VAFKPMALSHAGRPSLAGMPTDLLRCIPLSTCTYLEVVGRVSAAIGLVMISDAAWVASAATWGGHHRAGPVPAVQPADAWP